jgi:hypothetical protein
VCDFVSPLSFLKEEYEYPEQTTMLSVHVRVCARAIVVRVDASTRDVEAILAPFNLE